MTTPRTTVLPSTPTVFGTRQAGIRLILTHDAAAAVDEDVPAVGLTEDESIALPAWLVAQHACDAGVSECTLDRDGNPLYLGREARLFSAKQKLTLAVRDGGCRWHGCDRPASYCEAHHVDQWHADSGRTDVDRGILLCRFHHMALRHGGWRITRDGPRDFVLHPPGGADPVILVPRLARRYLWATSPPPARFRPAA